MTLLSVRNVGKSYLSYGREWHRFARYFGMTAAPASENWVLRGINFDVAPGEIFGVVGPNGAGKSTLLKMICGIIKPSEGEVRAASSAFGIIELGMGFDQELTGRQNAAQAASLMGFKSSEIEEMIPRIEAFAEVGEFFDKPVRTYSSGMLLRVAFSVAIASPSDILIFDEAFAVGDWLFQKKCFQELMRLKALGKAILIVSHSEEAILTLTERATLINDGKTVLTGESKKVMQRYREINNMRARALTGTGTSDAREEAVRTVQPSAEIEQVTVFDGQGKEQRVFFPGEKVVVRVDCRANEAITSLNVALRFRTKEQIKICSWGTLNQDMSYRGRDGNTDLFCERHFAPGEKFSVSFPFETVLGAETYEIQVAITQEPSKDFSDQIVLDWREEAAFIEMQQKKEEHFFGGFVDLLHVATWEKPQR